jgi:hypothetical protein
MRSRHIYLRGVAGRAYSLTSKVRARPPRSCRIGPHSSSPPRSVTAQQNSVNKSVTGFFDAASSPETTNGTVGGPVRNRGPTPPVPTRLARGSQVLEFGLHSSFAAALRTNRADELPIL